MTYDKLVKDMLNCARDELKEGLAQCTVDQRQVFKLMYSHKDLTLPIEKVVDNMNEDKIERAMDQVERTVKKNKEKIDG